jgi:hypothetical protein
MPRTLLSIYLADHLSGATAGVALARRAAKHHEGTPAGRRLAQVAHEIEDDRETRKLLMSELGMRGSRVKNAAAWVTERLARLKPNGRARGENILHRMHELEALSLGIAGKQALWSALRVAPQAPAIAGVDLDVLGERAASQRERVEIERIALARAALSLSPESAHASEQTTVGDATQ